MGIGPILKIVSGLDLEISGALGSFSVKPAAPNQPSIPVRYIQTHITFNLDGSQKERLFQNLLPVREIFETKDLGFDDLMQRDIDDGRVSNSLIPYLLQSGEAVKFFPPIVAVVVPVGADKELLSSYPKIIEQTSDVEGATYKQVIQRSGQPGQEAFEFEQVEHNGMRLEFDNARLRINTNRCKIVIVDGQHRAMALLALYRNIKGWPDHTAAIKHYYQRWTKDLLKNFDLKEISLPIAICTFPTLFEGNSPYKVTQACRSIFLALNKNARPVSRSRNILLDDKDLLSHFEREILEEVKSFKIDAPSRLRLWNFELDAEKNGTVLTTAVALSGIMHLYALLERVLLLSQQPNGLNVHGTQNWWLTRNIEGTAIRRLDGRNLLGEELAKNTTRNMFAPDALKLLSNSFREKYLRYIVKGFQEFYPYTAMARAASDTEVELRAKTDKRTHSMLFEGQGVLRVFRQYVDDLTTEEKEQKALNQSAQASELAAILAELRDLESNVEKYEDVFRARRTERLLATVAKTKLEYLNAPVDLLYKNDLTTAAFQIGLFATFFFTIEDFNGRDNGEARLVGDEQEMALFEEYVACLNAFFSPQSDSEAKRLFSTFLGSVSGSFGSANMKITESDSILRKIVVPGELKPDEWPRFRYIFLELWRPQNEALGEIIRKYRDQCRVDVLKAFIRQKLKAYARSESIEETMIKDNTRAKLSKEATLQFENALSSLPAGLSEEEKLSLRALGERPAPPPPVEEGTSMTEEEQA
jgi:hypothetical protein